MDHSTTGEGNTRGHVSGTTLIVGPIVLAVPLVVLLGSVVAAGPALAEALVALAAFIGLIVWGDRVRDRKAGVAETTAFATVAASAVVFFVLTFGDDILTGLGAMPGCSPDYSPDACLP